MKWLGGLKLVLGSAAIWTLTLWLSRSSPIPGPGGLFLAIAAVGLPAFFTAVLAYRQRLPVPAAWGAVGYCLGSGAATGIVYARLARQVNEAVSVEWLGQTILAHIASATVLVPVNGALEAHLGNLLGLAIVVVLGLYGIEAYRGTGRKA